MDKPFYRSKTFYGSLLIFIGGGLSALGFEALGGPLVKFGMAIAAFGIRDAIK